jgi:trehalose 6-phosphate synthase
MDVVSYRGPGVAGGVSSGLENAWRGQKVRDTFWWFISGQALTKLQPAEGSEPSFITQLSEQTVEGHYSFCNSFLWPIMHDLPQYVSFDDEAYRRYREFNRILGQYIAFEQTRSAKYFVNDYQLALLPLQLGEGGCRVSLFWHIPWPKQIAPEHEHVIADMARGMLKSRVVGFHTNEYAENFMRFVHAHLPEYKVDLGKQYIRPRQEMGAAQNQHSKEHIFGLSSFITRPYRFPPQGAPFIGTQLIVQPLGIDRHQWYQMAENQADDRVREILSDIGERRLVLSVDRADYTKAVVERLKIIDRFFMEHPHWAGRVSFVQICGRSRKGISAFDQYWSKCRGLAETINERWRSSDWLPINWIEDPLPAKSLSVLYRHADSMLVNPVRDGLNLTAKEFVACQSAKSGVLLLSPGAGAWHELGSHALPADPNAVHRTVDAIAQSLNMPPLERKWRTDQLKRALDQNPLHRWWKAIATSEHQIATPLADFAIQPEERDDRRALSA